MVGKLVKSRLVSNSLFGKRRRTAQSAIHRFKKNFTKIQNLCPRWGLCPPFLLLEGKVFFGASNCEGTCL